MEVYAPRLCLYLRVFGVFRYMCTDADGDISNFISRVIERVLKSGPNLDSNPGPSDYWSDTLTTELLGLWWQRSAGLMFIS